MRQHLLEYIDKGTSANVRGLRIMTEYFYAQDLLGRVLKPEVKVVSVFGSARLKPGERQYEVAKKLGRALYESGFAVVTGGSNGIMQAANEGVYDAIVAECQAKHRSKSVDQIKNSSEFKRMLEDHSLGLKISLPFELDPNPYLGVTATFHYFMVRKFFFAKISSAFIACEGGWGTRDELFEVLTLVQTGKAPLMPIIYVSKTPDHLRHDVNFAVKKHYIAPEDRRLLDIVTDYETAVEIVKKFYRHVSYICYDKKPKVEIYLKRPLNRGQMTRVRRLVEVKHKENLKGLKFFKNKFELVYSKHKSYGLLREIVDAL